MRPCGAGLDRCGLRWGWWCPHGSLGAAAGPTARRAAGPLVTAALLLVYLLNPAVSGLERRGVNRWVTTTLVFLVLLACLGLLLVPVATAQVEQFARRRHSPVGSGPGSTTCSTGPVPMRACRRAQALATSGWCRPGRRTAAREPCRRARHRRPGGRVPPLAVILALLVAAPLFGLLGMALAVPVAAAVKILAGHWWASRTLRTEQQLGPVSRPSQASNGGPLPTSFPCRQPENLPGGHR